MVKYLKLNFLLLLLLILIPFSTLDGFAQIQNEVTKSGTGGSGEGVFFVNTYPFSFKAVSYTHLTLPTPPFV